MFAQICRGRRHRRPFTKADQSLFCKMALHNLLIRLRSAQPPVSLRLGHARGKTTLSCFLRPSRRFATYKRRLIKFVLSCVGLCFVTDVFIGSLREGAPVCDGWRSTRVLRNLISFRQEKLLPSTTSLRSGCHLPQEGGR